MGFFTAIGNVVGTVVKAPVDVVKGIVEKVTEEDDD